MAIRLRSEIDGEMLGNVEVIPEHVSGIQEHFKILRCKLCRSDYCKQIGPWVSGFYEHTAVSVTAHRSRQYLPERQNYLVDPKTIYTRRVRLVDNRMAKQPVPLGG